MINLNNIKKAAAIGVFVLGGCNVQKGSFVDDSGISWDYMAVPKQGCLEKHSRVIRQETDDELIKDEPNLNEDKKLKDESNFNEDKKLKDKSKLYKYKSICNDTSKLNLNVVNIYNNDNDNDNARSLFDTSEKVNININDNNNNNNNNNNKFNPFEDVFKN